MSPEEAMALPVSSPQDGPLIQRPGDGIFPQGGTYWITGWLDEKHVRRECDENAKSIDNW